MAGHTVLMNSFLSTTDTSSAYISAVYPIVAACFCVLVQLPNMPRVCCVRIKLSHHSDVQSKWPLHIYMAMFIIVHCPTFCSVFEKCSFVQKQQFILFRGSNVGSSVCLVSECSSSPQPRHGRDAPWWGHARRTHATRLFPGQSRSQSGIRFYLPNYYYFLPCQQICVWAAFVFGFAHWTK